jgi:hypothetical protein
LGDSFTLGYTVDRKDLFVDLLENKYREEGRKIEIINGGTEGYSTDQELLWLREEGLKFAPDLVVMNFYQNDVFWNSQDHYMRFPKPMFPAEGSADKPVNKPLEDPGRESWLIRGTAVGNRILKPILSGNLPLFETKDGTVIPKEWGVLLKEEPDFILKAWKHTQAVLKGFRSSCEEQGIKPILALIPAKAQVYDEFKQELGEQLRLPPEAWDPNLPMERVKAICRAIGLDVIDPMARHLKAGSEGPMLYYAVDRHFSPAGNVAFAQAIYDHLNQDNYLGQPKGSVTPIVAQSDAAPEPIVMEASGFPTWLAVVLILWAVLGLMYAFSYRDENGFLGFMKVGTLIWVVVGLVALLNLLASAMPAGAGGLVFAVVILAILIFLLWKLRKRAGLILELYANFTDRGHWYMIPLLAVMLAIGSLLIVAASSPFVAPFIYTLF